MSSRSQQNRVTIQEFRPEEIPMSCSWIVVGPPGSGKCLGKGTELLMYDGSVKKVEEVVNGDILIGDDSLPRVVQGVTSGHGKLFHIEQSNGDSYVVNAPHILVLRKKQEPKVYQDSRGECWYIEWYENGKRVFTHRTTQDEALAVSNDVTREGKYDKYKVIEIEAETYYNRISSCSSYPTSSSSSSSINDDICDYRGYKANVQFQKGKVTAEERLNFLAKFIDLTDKTDKLNEYTITIRHERLADKIKLVSDTLGFHTTIKRDIYVNIDQNEGRSEPITVPESSSTTSSISPEARSLPEAAPSGSSSSDSSNSSLVSVVNDKGEEMKKDVSESVYTITIKGMLNRIPVEKPRKMNDTDVCDSELTITSIDDGEWFGFEIDGNKRFLLRDTTVTHNTTFIENMMYILKDRYPVATAFIGTEGAYDRFSKILHPLYVRPKYDEEEEKSHILRQKTCATENGTGHPANYAINVLDDVSDDPRIYKSSVMKGLFKLGSQHWHQLLFVGSQYAIDMPPDVRKSVSYVAIFLEPEELERKKLYQNFGGLAGTYDNFCDLMDQLTGDYTCLIFKKRTQSQALEENVFWFRGQALPPSWKFGCKEYRKWAEDRYDKDYVEDPQV
jgi:hypothetical protein